MLDETLRIIFPLEGRACDRRSRNRFIWSPLLLSQKLHSPGRYVMSINAININSTFFTICYMLRVTQFSGKKEEEKLPENSRCIYKGSGWTDLVNGHCIRCVLKVRSLQAFLNGILFGRIKYTISLIEICFNRIKVVIKSSRMFFKNSWRS